jgi:glucuronate isomerase
MKKFLDEDFLLENKYAAALFHEFAKPMPIIDYHNHLSPALIARDHQFENLTKAWLDGDHYKWRAMRWNGVEETYCSGNAPDEEKFMKWAATVPYLLRNPLYHWTHLELRRYFEIDELLSAETGSTIYAACTEKLNTPSHSVRKLLQKMKVEIVCTTDDPVDSLEHHCVIADENYAMRVLPSFRPDKAMAVENVPAFNAYVDSLERVTNVTCDRYPEYLDALKKRHDYFAEMGCAVADHGLHEMYAEEYRDAEIRAIYVKLRQGSLVSEYEKRQFRSALLYQFALWNHERGWVQQLHIGPLRNNNSRMMRSLGPDTGWDSMGGSVDIRAVGKFLDRLDQENSLTRTILYSIYPYDHELLTTMAGNFNDGSYPGKLQCGAPWWFNDQQQGIVQHLDVISNMGLLSRFVGMLTDSRSFLSFPRHEYFRRLLCNVLGRDIERGELPNDMDWIGKVVQDICYYNTKRYFNF